MLNMNEFARKVKILSLILLFLVLGCGHEEKSLMQPIMPNIVDNEQPTEASQDDPYADLPLITTTDLKPGLYRMKAYVGGSQTSDRGAKIISVITLIDQDENVYDLTADSISVMVVLDPKPNLYTPDGELVIQEEMFNLDIDSGPDKWALHPPTLIVVEITEFIEKVSKGKPKLIDYMYKGSLVANLTHPDRPFEYEE